MSDTHPLTRKLTAQVPAQATAATDQANAVGVAPWAATVKSVTLIPAALITGAATNNRKFALVNKAQDGSGTTEIASLTFGNGTNAAAHDEKALTLSGTPASLVVAAGDVLAVVETHNGTGMASPGALAVVELSRN